MPKHLNYFQNFKFNIAIIPRIKIEDGTLNSLNYSDFYENLSELKESILKHSLFSAKLERKDVEKCEILTLLLIKMKFYETSWF